MHPLFNRHPKVLFGSCLLSLFAAFSLPIAEAKDSAAAPKGPPIFKCGQSDYRIYQSGDKFGRKITFFVSMPTDSILKGINNRARLVIVEKPGAKLFSPRLNSTEEFLKEYTLDRWTEANNAALSALRNSPEFDKSKLLVIGHSDGGQVATHLARSNSAVTHVASLAGGGPTQLFDMSYNASGAEQQKQDSSQQVERVYQTWEKIKADPHSITKTAWGHPFNRWSSFLASSSIDDLLHCKTKAYLVHGTADTSVPVASFDVMRAELTTHGREAKYERIDGANHGMTIGTGRDKREELPNILARIIEWYLGK